MLVKTRPEIAKTLTLFILSVFLLQESPFAHEKGGIIYTTLPGSRLWFDGTSTLNDYTCSTREVEGYAEITRPADTRADGIKKDKVLLTVTVRTLDCGNNTMNKDMYKAMKADLFPEIKYELVTAKVLVKKDSTGRIGIIAIGNMYVAGKKKLEKMKVYIEKLDGGNLHLTGSFPMSMLDYGITPPQHLLGLIKAHDKLVVHFDLIIAEGRQGSVIHE